MGFVRQVKERMVNELAKRYSKYQNFVLVDFRGIKARDANTLRKDLKTEGVRMNVVKNAVAKYALEKAGLKELAANVTDMNAVIYGEDPVAVAKKLYEFIDKAKVLKVKSGLIDGKLVPAEQIKELSKMPGKKELQSILIGTIQAPVSQFVSTLNSVLVTFVGTLKALEEKLPKS
jgi:large subunit ribosomal protein L10